MLLLWIHIFSGAHDIFDDFNCTIRSGIHIKKIISLDLNIMHSRSLKSQQKLVTIIWNNLSWGFNITKLKGCNSKTSLSLQSQKLFQVLTVFVSQQKSSKIHVVTSIRNRLAVTHRKKIFKVMWLKPLAQIFAIFSLSLCYSYQYDVRTIKLQTSSIPVRRSLFFH